MISAAKEVAKPARVVVVEDESDIGALLEYLLDREGFDVVVARTGQDALREIAQRLPDLVLLDLMLPDVDGLDILREIKRRDTAERTRVLILSAKKAEDDRILGLEHGADDYVVKPFSPRELLLRVRSLLQREGAGPRVEAARLVSGPIELDLDTHVARVAGRAIRLTLTEFRLLASLVRNEGRVRSREALLTEVWGYDSEALSRTVDTHVRRLRSKLGPGADWLGTVRGVGYRLRDPKFAED